MRHVARMAEKKKCCTVVDRFEEKIPLGRPRRRWDDNTKMYRIEIV